ncbi:nuclear transport factor 2 family protein [Croceicoccus bisphenolivorans]|uniref:nuclear transport factor 2 family protein n=1 Tax=Croceicoccus bisphenolivorans TaxID=1783232 RepID=UPI000832AC97|nr:nuclear transport factor 2 family protein [Croceicoccus bisphenolivorans]
MNIEDLSCKIGCQDALVALCSALDAGDNDAAADLFTDDGVLILPTGEKRGAEVRAALNARSSTITTCHIMTNVLVTPRSATEASAAATITVYRVQTEGNASASLTLPETPQAIGEWGIDLRLTPDGWRISRYTAAERMAPAK